MRFGMARRAQRGAVWEVHVKGPRDADVLGNIPIHHDAHRRDAFCLDGTGNQSHGLLADRSARSEKRGVNTVCGQAARHLRCGLINQLK
jgi:hypothetical protein